MGAWRTSVVRNMPGPDDRRWLLDALDALVRDRQPRRVKLVPRARGVAPPSARRWRLTLPLNAPFHGLGPVGSSALPIVAEPGELLIAAPGAVCAINPAARRDFVGIVLHPTLLRL